MGEKKELREKHTFKRRVSRKQERLAYAPHFASLVGVEIDPSNRRIKLGADFQSDEIFRMSIIHGGTPIHGVSSDPKERLEWAQRHVERLGGSLDKSFFNTVDKYGNKARRIIKTKKFNK